MGGSYFGEASLGNGRSGSSRKGKKSNSDKPRQPQRGLGVAQLEKIRLSNEMGSCYLPSLHNPSHTNLNQMGFGDMETANIIYGEPQSGGAARTGWNYNKSIVQPQQAVESSITRQFLTLPVEVDQRILSSSQQKRSNEWCNSRGSSSQNCNSSDDQELDLDLKLSL